MININLNLLHVIKFVGLLWNSSYLINRKFHLLKKSFVKHISRVVWWTIVCDIIYFCVERMPNAKNNKKCSCILEINNNKENPSLFCELLFSKLSGYLHTLFKKWFEKKGATQNRDNSRRTLRWNRKIHRKTPVAESLF